MVGNFKRSVGSLLRLRSQVCLGSLVGRVKLEGRRGFEELSFFCWTVADGVASAVLGLGSFGEWWLPRCSF